MMSEQDFNSQVSSIRTERDFNAFITQNQNDPRVMKMLQMTSGRDPMQVAQNLAQTNKQDFGALRNSFGF